MAAGLRREGLMQVPLALTPPACLKGVLKNNHDKNDKHNNDNNNDNDNDDNNNDNDNNDNDSCCPESLL